MKVRSISGVGFGRTGIVIALLSLFFGAVAQALVNCAGLLPRALRTPKTDVLNGIACDPATGRIYLTGKYRPRLYEVELREQR